MQGKTPPPPGPEESVGGGVIYFEAAKHKDTTDNEIHRER